VRFVHVAPAADTLYVGEAHTFRVTVTDSVHATVPAEGVRWSVSDARVATLVPTAGAAELTARAGGAVTATAELAGGARGRATLVVHPTTVPVRAWPDTNVLVPDLARRLELREYPSHGDRRALAAARWSTDAPAVATVDDSGRVTAVGPGRAVITGTAAAAGDRVGTAVVVVETYPTPLTFTSVVTGTAHACGLTADGRAYCWGDNAGGTLGTTRPRDRCEAQRSVWTPGRCSAIPAEVDGGLRFTQLTAFLHHTCGVATDGGAYCWGWNLMGQLGGGAEHQSAATPRRVPGEVRFRALSAGGGFTCGLAADSAAYCWGRNDAGRIGLGDAGELAGQGTVFATPQRVAGGLAFSQLSTGGAHACALTADGTAYCWGDNGSGQLGIGPDGARGCGDACLSTRPVPVAGPRRYAQVMTGRERTCALDTEGGLWCWGETTHGTTADPGVAVSRVPLRHYEGQRFSRLVGISLHAGPTCALGPAGELLCFGGIDAGRTPPLVRAFAPLTFRGGSTGREPYISVTGCLVGADGAAACRVSATMGQRGTGELPSWWSPAASLTALPLRVVGQP
jgi:alpha-tubulin suppressor-like RCC1 family protein